MGDRILMQCFSSSSKEFGPVVYGHWCGESGPAIVAALREQMKPRGDDVQYASARLVECVVRLSGTAGKSESVGIWNAPAVLTAEDSHGDAGVVLIDTAFGYAATYMGGYLGEGRPNV